MNMLFLLFVLGCFAIDNFCGDETENGNTVTWAISTDSTTSTNILTISGVGKMKDFGTGTTPWSNEQFAKLVISEGVTSIGSGAFPYNYDLKTVEIASTVKTIGNGAFDGCSAFTTIEFKGTSQLETITDNAFKGTKLSSITIPKSVKTIGDNAFSGRRMLSQSIVFEEGIQLESIGQNAFNQLSYTGDVVIPSVKIIGNSAFSSSQIKTLTITSVETIGDSAFSSCFSLESVTFGSTLKSIAANAFEYSSSIKAINIDGEGGLYSSIDGVLIKNENNEKELVSYPNNKEGSDYTVPEGVTTIATNAFQSCPNLDNSIDCGPVKTIKSLAFQNLRIKSISFPNVETLQTSALKKCVQVTSISFGKSLKTIESNAFEDSTGITEFIINENENYKTVDGILFTNDGSILLKCPPAKQFTGKYVIPENVVTIYEYAFSDQATLSEVEIGNQVENIRFNAFSSSTQLKKVTLSGNIKSISNAVFSQCTALEEVIIGDNVKMIGSSMFLACSSLKTVTIGENSQIVTIEKDAFQSSGITSFTIPKVTKYIRNRAFAECESLETVVIGEAVSHIAEEAFTGCAKLKTVTFKGSNVLRINEKAFYGSTIESIEIPSSVKYIDDEAFYTSTTLKSITFKGDKQPAYCSASAFNTKLMPKLTVDDAYAQQEFCGISTGKGTYPDDLPETCKQEL